MRLAPALSLALLLAAGPALASPETAGKIRDEVAGALDLASGGLNRGQLLFGEVRVDDLGAETYRVTVPGIGLHNLEDGAKADIGDVSFLVSPVDGGYRFSEVSIPERIVAVDPQGAELGSVSFDLRRLSGLWWPDLRETPELDLLLSGLEIFTPERGVLARIDEISALFALESQSPDRFLQTQVGAVRGISVVPEPGDGLKIGAIEWTARVDQLDLEGYRTAVAVLEDLVQAAGSGDLTRAEGLRQTLPDLLDVADAMEQRIVVRGLGWEADGAPGGIGELVLALTAATSADRETGSIDLGISAQDIDLADSSPQLAAYEALLPTAFTLPLRLEGLPSDTLAQVLTDLIFSLSQEAVQPEGPLQSSGMALLQGMQAAGARVVIDGLKLATSTARLEGDGLLTLSQQSPLGAVGQARATLVGIDRMLAFAEQMTDPDAKQTVSAAALGLMAMGQAQALSDGSVGYVFAFTFTPDGQLLLNGKSMGHMLGVPQPQ